MTYDDAITASSWLRAGRDAEYIASVLGCTVADVEALRAKRFPVRFVPSPSEIPRLAALVRAQRTGPSGQHEPSAEGVRGPGVRQCFPDGYGWSSVG